MMNEAVAGALAGYSVTARRNNSLSSSGRNLVFGFVLFVTLSIGLTFLVVGGAWPILPFGGLEIVGLFLAFRYIGLHAGDYERLAIAGNRLQFEFVEVDHVRRIELDRYWAQVVCAADGSRLALRSRGREVEFGRFLTAEERIDVASALRRELRGAY